MLSPSRLNDFLGCEYRTWLDDGELLAADARAVAGQALSRLLNVTDGLFGEGLRTLVVVTTTEPLRSCTRRWSAPAAAGPGSSSRRSPPTRPTPGCPRGAPPTGRAATLAELFALAGGGVVPSRVAVGITAAR